MSDQIPLQVILISLFIHYVFVFAVVEDSIQRYISCGRKNYWYLLVCYYAISILVLPTGRLEDLFGISIWRMPLFILAVIFEGSISSGIGMLRSKDLNERSLYMLLCHLSSLLSSSDCSPDISDKIICRDQLDFVLGNSRDFEADIVCVSSIHHVNKRRFICSPLLPLYKGLPNPNFSWEAPIRHRNHGFENLPTISLSLNHW